MGAAVLVCLVVVVVRRRLFVVTVRGTSMEPTFRSGDRLLARRVRLAAVRVGDVVIIGTQDPHGHILGRVPTRASAQQAPTAPGGVPGSDWIIKRAAAIPGDPIPRDRFAALAQVDGSAVPEGKLVILGDNPFSADSRLHGYYDGDRLAGVVVRKLRGSSQQNPAPVVVDSADPRAVRTTGQA